MIKKKRYLITTEDEATWKFDQPVIFLGEWCRLYDRKHIWQNMDAIDAKPYVLDVISKDKHDLKVKDLEKKIFPEICEILNKNFNTNYSNRFWQIILGPWFRNILQILLYRTTILKQCLQSEEILGTTLYRSDYCSLAIPDLKSGFIYFFEDEKWNNVLSGRILNLIDSKIPINFIKDGDDKYSYQIFKSHTSNNNQSFKENIKDYFLRRYKKIAEKLVRDKDAFLINTYLNSKQLFKLELNFGQFPQFWKKIATSINTKPDQLLRENLTKKFLKKTEDDLENILRNLLFELLPVSYLEGFQELAKIVNQQPWPKSPKFIFTSNNFGTDEIFKLYTAIKTENGSKYYIGQHGNNYFTQRHYFPRIEEQTADKFLTWGWKSKFSKYIPMFIFKTIGEKSNYNNKGRLLLIERPNRRVPLMHWNDHSEFSNYFEDQKKFVSELAPEPKQNLIIRLSVSQTNTKLNETSRWFDFNKSLKIDDGRIMLQNLITESRLVIHTYDTTGLLENLSQNIPTLVFWQNGFDHLREEVKPDYQMLINAGILHFCPKSAAKKTNEIWDNVDEWWSERNVQDARKNFCDIYAKYCENPTKTLVSFFSKK